MLSDDEYLSVPVTEVFVLLFILLILCISCLVSAYPE